MLDSDDFNRRLFFPRADVSLPPSGAVDSTVEVPGASLHVRHHRAPGALGTLLLFHGNGEVVRDYDGMAPSFARAGLSLAVVDFRGYGRSSGTPTLRSAIADARVVLTALLASKPGPLVVMGRSLGSACASELYALASPDVSGFILESGFVDLDALVRRRGLSMPPLGPDALAVFDPIPKLASGSRPLLVLHGALDTLISPAEARRAFEAAGTQQKRLCLVPGRGHNDISLSVEYWDALSEFVRSVTPTSAAR